MYPGCDILDVQGREIWDWEVRTRVCRGDSPLLGVVACALVKFLVKVSGVSALWRVIVVVVVGVVLVIVEDLVCPSVSL